jgi:hypothetical protein
MFLVQPTNYPYHRISRKTTKEKYYSNERYKKRQFYLLAFILSPLN